MNKDFDSHGEMVAATLRGYRSWNFFAMSSTLPEDLEEPKLRVGALSHHGYWANSEITARCGSHTGHQAPDTQCGCGLYGWYDPFWVAKMHVGTTMGVVEFSGKILMGTKGFRAEKARVVAIAINDLRDNFDDHIRDVLWRMEVVDYIRDELMKDRTVADFNISVDDVESLRKKISDQVAKLSPAEILGTLNQRLHNLVQAECYSGIEAYNSSRELIAAYPPDWDTPSELLKGKMERASMEMPEF